jgi:hypothetical protein
MGEQSVSCTLQANSPQPSPSVRTRHTRCVAGGKRSEAPAIFHAENGVPIETDRFYEAHLYTVTTLELNPHTHLDLHAPTLAVAAHDSGREHVFDTHGGNLEEPNVVARTVSWKVRTAASSLCLTIVLLCLLHIKSNNAVSLGRSSNAIRAACSQSRCHMAWRQTKCVWSCSVRAGEEECSVYKRRRRGLQREKRLHATKLRGGKLPSILQNELKVEGGEAGQAETGRPKRGGYRFFVFLSLDSNAFQLQNLAGA